MSSTDFESFSRTARAEPERPSRREAERALAFPAFFRSLALALRDRIEARRVRRALDALPDRLLADVGIERADLPRGVRRDLEGQ